MKKSKYQAAQDPHRAREAQKYERPVPSREHILLTLTEAQYPLTLSDLLILFEINDDAGQEGVRRRLLAMERDGQAVGNEQGAYRPFIEGQDKMPARSFRSQFVEKVTQDQVIEDAVKQFNLPQDWPAEVLRECEKWGDTISAAEAKRRKDIRHLPLVTIDGADARDFDDAVYTELLPNNHYKLIVAIADVSFYVRYQGSTDQEALKRGTSIYFPQKVIPMLPEALSNELCSLKPNVDRLCLVCEMEIDATGVLIHSTFYEAVMRSHARLTYNLVAEFLAVPEKITAEPFKQHAAVWPHIVTFYDLFKTLICRTRGARRLGF